MLTAMCAGSIVSYRVTGSILPSDQKDALLFQNGLLLIVLGSAIIEYKFTKPADSVVNALMGMTTLVGVYRVAPTRAWWAMFLYCAAVFGIGTICVAVSAGPHIAGWREAVARKTYKPAVFFGRARLLYSILFLFALLSFRSLQSAQTLELLLFWGLFVVVWPLGLPELLTSFQSRRSSSEVAIGRVIRTDWPNIIRVQLEAAAAWGHDSVKLLRRIDGAHVLVVPLYAEPQGDQLIGTGICIGPSAKRYTGLLAGVVYDAPKEEELSDTERAKALGADPSSRVVGFVIEDSQIAHVRFETWDVNACHEGMLVFSLVGKNRVYYQITDGATRDEAFQTNRHGYQVATAAQVGLVHPERGFAKHSWLPPMNAPVGCVPRLVEIQAVASVVPLMQRRLS